METYKPSITNSVETLKESICAVLDAYSNNLNKIALGEKPEVEISEKSIDMLIKIAQRLPKLIALESMAAPSDEEAEETKPEESAAPTATILDIRNPLEDAIRNVKTKALNGTTTK